MKGLDQVQQKAVARATGLSLGMTITGRAQAPNFWSWSKRAQKWANAEREDFSRGESQFSCNAWPSPVLMKAMATLIFSGPVRLSEETIYI